MPNYNETYEVGNVVPESGTYVCVPCGNKKFLKAGTRFTSCLKCFGKEERGLLIGGLELWKRIYEPR